MRQWPMQTSALSDQNTALRIKYAIYTFTAVRYFLYGVTDPFFTPSFFCEVENDADLMARSPLRRAPIA
jgi:hypothetical protein